MSATVWLDGLRSVGYRWIVGGWIYSKPVGWLVCSLLSVDWSDGWSVVGLPAGLFLIRSVGRWVKLSGRLAIQPITDCPSIRLYLIANQSIKERSFVQVTSACISGIRTGVRCISVFVWAVGCGGGTWPMSASHWLSLGRISSRLSGQWRI